MQFKLLFKYSGTLLIIVLTAVMGASEAFAQSSSFIYQGRLTDGGTAANGNYDLQFALWDSLSNGTQIGSTQTVNTTPVSAGVFTVTLDFGAGSFPGANRFLEISARPSGSGSFILLTPRQPVTSTPYSVRSLSAASADSVTVTGIPSGSGNYLQNTTSTQPATNFNISGNGTVGGTLSGNAVNATMQFKLNGISVLSEPSGNCGQNLFVGDLAGELNTSGCANTFVGVEAGNKNNGQFNSFFGERAGGANQSGGQNSAFGYLAGAVFTSGDNNSFFGSAAGGNLILGNNNTFIGGGADVDSSTAAGDSNTIVGAGARMPSGLTNATAIGFKARATQNNTLVLGGINGVNGAIADTKVGIGMTTPRSALEVQRNWDGSFGALTVTGDRPTIRFSGGGAASNAQWILHLGGAAGPSPAGSLSFFYGGTAGTSFGNAVLSMTPTGTVVVSNLGAAGSTQLCRNGSSEISTCSSSFRYKTNIASFRGGLDIIKRLRPISFEWKQNHLKDIGLGAEEVEKVEPLLTFRNDKGETEGVKYNQLSAVFINAFKEQQAQISQQQEQIERQQKQLREQQSSATLQEAEIKILNSRLQAIERVLRKRSSSRK